MREMAMEQQRLAACLAALQVLNKYFPPDFDPTALPKRKRGAANDMKVRMMLPMSVRCKTCGNFMYKGTKFNMKKEDVLGESYLGIQVRAHVPCAYGVMLCICMQVPF